MDWNETTLVWEAHDSQREFLSLQSISFMTLYIRSRYAHMRTCPLQLRECFLVLVSLPGASVWLDTTENLYFKKCPSALDQQQTFTILWVAS